MPPCRLLITSALALAACADAPTITEPPANPRAVKFWEVNAATRWNRRALDLVALRPPANGQAAASRILTYLSLAQYRAALATAGEKDGNIHPSTSAAIAAASVAVLSSFFPLDVAFIEAELDADLGAPGWPGAKNRDAEAGESVGRAIGAAVVTLAGSDNYLVATPATPPVGPGFWVSAAAPVVRSLHGTRPFFLPSPDAIRAPPPPAYGSAAFLAGLAEVRAISDSRTAEQTSIAVQWNTATAPFTAGTMNLILDELLEEHHRGERESARILAYANAAAFDAQIACWDSKLHYWFIRPAQADPAITMPIGLPNHPSYPSGHSCITAAVMTVAKSAFPREASRLEGIIELAGMSRIFGGIHYRFDVEAGREIGRKAAALSLAGKLE